MYFITDRSTDSIYEVQCRYKLKDGWIPTICGPSCLTDRLWLSYWTSALILKNSEENLDFEAEISFESV